MVHYRSSSNVLFLDDMEERHQLFREHAPAQWSVYHSYSAEDAIRLLSKHFFWMVWLDHDLSDEHYRGEQNDNSGLAVARFLADKVSEEFKPVIVAIHSWNSVGAKEMHATLKGKVPFVVVQPFGPEMLKSVKQMYSKVVQQ